MLNPSDNDFLLCSVGEQLMGDDFKLELYPLWVEMAFIVINEICKVKERFSKLSTDTPHDPIIAELTEHTEKWVSKIMECSEDYDREIRDSINFLSDTTENELLEAEDQRRKDFKELRRKQSDGLDPVPQKVSLPWTYKVSSFACKISTLAEPSQDQIDVSSVN